MKRTRILGLAAALYTGGCVAVACQSFGSSDVPGDGADAQAFGDGGQLDSGQLGANKVDAGRFCEGVDASLPTTLCADFDGVNPLEGWEMINPAEVTGGSVGPESDVAFSPPTALRSTTTGDQTGPHAAPLAKIFVKDGGVHSIRARLKLNVSSQHPSSYAHLFALRFGGKYIQFVLAVEGTNVMMVEASLLPEAGPPIRHLAGAAANLATNRWVDVELQVSAPGQMQLFVAGTNVLTTAVTIADAAPQPAAVVYSGLWSDPADASWTALYDNIVIDVQ